MVSIPQDNLCLVSTTFLPSSECHELTIFVKSFTVVQKNAKHWNAGSTINILSVQFIPLQGAKKRVSGPLNKSTNLTICKPAQLNVGSNYIPAHRAVKRVLLTFSCSKRKLIWIYKTVTFQWQFNNPSSQIMLAINFSIGLTPKCLGDNAIIFSAIRNKIQYCTFDLGLRCKGTFKTCLERFKTVWKFEITNGIFLLYFKSLFQLGNTRW